MNLLSLNTKGVGYAGIAVAIAGLVLDANFQTSLAALMPTAWVPVFTKVVTLIGAVAAYYGMPHSVKGAA